MDSLETTPTRSPSSLREVAHFMANRPSRVAQRFRERPQLGRPLLVDGIRRDVGTDRAGIGQVGTHRSPNLCGRTMFGQSLLAVHRYAGRDTAFSDATRRCRVEICRVTKYWDSRVR